MFDGEMQKKCCGPGWYAPSKLFWANRCEILQENRLYVNIKVKERG